jgi:hypothetical protein
MTTHEHPTEATPTLEEQPDTATPGADPRTPPAQSTAPTGPSTPPTESTVPGGQWSAAETNAVGRHADVDSSVPSQAPPDGAYSPTAHTESEIADTQSAARTIDAAPAPSEAESDSERSLFADDELAGLRARWDNVQAAFVDDPKDCVHKADSLVSDVVKQLTTGFTEARSRLEQQWGRGEQASTEDLRMALKRYRDFFDRLLAV